MAKNNVTITGVSSQGTGVYSMIFDYGTATNLGVTSQSGSVLVKGLSGSTSYFGTYWRLPTLAANNITITGAGGYGVCNDFYSSLNATSGDINLIGYSTTSAALWFNASSGYNINAGGNVIFSAKSMAEKGIDSSTTITNNSVTAGGSVTFQGATIASSSLATNVLNSSFAAADSAARLLSTSGGNYFGGAISAGSDVNVASTGSITFAGAISSTTGSVSVTDSSGHVTLSNNITTSAASKSILVQSYGSILISGTKTLTTNNGVVTLASDSGGAGNGGIKDTGTLTITTAGGNVFVGGGALTITNGVVTGIGYAQGRTSVQSEGVRFNALTITTANGNLVIKGKSGTSSQGGAQGAWGVGFDATTSINSGAGTIYISGVGQSNNAGDYTPGIVFAYSAGSYTQTITSANTSTTAIQIIGNAATAANASWNYGIMIHNAGSTVIAPTGVGGGITLQATRNTAGIQDDIYFGGTNYILAKSGPIDILGTTAGGRLRIGGSLNVGASTATAVTASTGLGSTLATAVATSTSNVKVQFDLWNWWTNNNGNNAGTVFNFYNSGTLSI